MRTLLAALALAGLAAAGSAQDTKPAKAELPKAGVQGDVPKKAEPTLKVGDPAPALKADAWLQGSQVNEFAPGQVYVVEFWATWCGPCIVMMPHLSQLQAEYKGKGVTLIGYTAKDPGNTKEKVTAFVEKRGPKLGYTMAYSESRETYEAWMKAAGRSGIPCCFVVGKDGKIAYIGHPMYLDVVLPKVVGGSWGPESVAEIAKIEVEVNGVFKALNNPDPEAALKTLADFEAKYPPLAHIPYFTNSKISLRLKAKQIDAAEKIANEVMARAIKQEDPTALRVVASALRVPAAKEHKGLGELSLKAALAGLKLSGEKDMGSLLNVADSYFALGNKEKAREYGALAVAAAEPRFRANVEKMIQRYEEKKDEK